MAGTARAPQSVTEEAAASDAATPESTSTAARRSDADYWAHPVARLSTAPGQAPLDTVRGKRAVGAIQGFGRLWQKTFRAPLGPDVTPREAVRFWREHFSELWPKGNTFYGPLTGIAPGEVALLQVGVMPGFRLSTGVVVIYVDEESFTFMTPQGHAFAGWITFSAAETASGTVAQISILVRGQSPISELGLVFGGHRTERRFWEATISALASRLGNPGAPIDTQIVCVDRRYQWRHVANIRHDASFRSALFMVAAPVRWARRSVGRR